MATLKRYVVEWTGLTGLPGISVHYSDNVSTLTSALTAFYTALGAVTTTPLSWSIPGSGDTIDSGTGTLNGAWSGGTPATVVPSSSTSYAAGTGMMVRWNTGAIRNGRKLQGRTFICPIGSGLYDTTGTIATSAITTVQTAATALVTAGGLVIWGRPGDTPPTNGVAVSVVSATVPDKVVSLRSRRR